MTNRTRALGHRLLSSLKNECIVIVSSDSTRRVSLVNGANGFPVALVAEDYDTGTYTLALAIGGVVTLNNFPALVGRIKACSAYPTPKARKSFVRPVNRGTRVLAVKAG